MQKSFDVASSEREADGTYTKAFKAEFAKNYDQAFGLYIKAAESFLHLNRSSSAVDDRTKQKWKSNATKALERAEKIKRFIDKPSGTLNSIYTPTDASNKYLRLTPVGINHFSPQEQFYVIQKGGSVNGLFFPMWDDTPHMSGSISEVYSDPDGQPKLSPEQQKVSPVWRRTSLATAHSLPPVPSPRRILPQEILQYIITDCSVCASISVHLEHSRRFGSALETAIHHTSSLTGKHGRYDVRVLFNGAWRRIVIDDRLPFHPTEGTLMCMSVLPSPSHSGGNELWPSLLEKAYMKLMGGYDFPGSNSSIDLHTLAGWIPEHIEIKSSAFERERSWDRIEMGFSTGQCVVTLGTGSTSYLRWRDVPLLPSHSYAVIDVYEKEDIRFLTVLDSWVRSDQSVREPSRILQIPWSEVLNVFEGVYLSWDPNIWQNTLSLHGMWKRNTRDEDGSRRIIKLEYSCQSIVDEEIWVLLTRHVVDTQRTSDFIALQVEMEDDQTQGIDIVQNQHVISTKGTYTNSTHILSRIRVPKSQRYGLLSISASYDGDAHEVGFTVTAYAESKTEISWIENYSIPPFNQKIEGSFTSKNAGGNCTYPSFMVNPQYRLTIHPMKSQGGLNGATSKAKVTLALQTNKDIPVNAAVVWSRGRRVSELSAKDLVATSGPYNYGLARVAKPISPGEYTIVASAFEPRHMGPFSLKVESSFPFDLEPIPQEGAAMYSKVMRGQWDGETAAGAPSFDKYPKNPVFELEVPSLTQLMVRVQLLQPSTAVALNVTVYHNAQNNIALSLRQSHITTSGAYADTIAGVATPQVTLGTGRYFIVPSTYNPGVEAGFRVIVYSSISGIRVTPAERRGT